MHTRKKLADAVCHALFYRMYGTSVYDESFWERQALATVRAEARQMLREIAYQIAYLQSILQSQSTEIGWHLPDERSLIQSERLVHLELRGRILHLDFYRMGLVKRLRFDRYIKEARRHMRTNERTMRQTQKDL